jgi:DNA-binding response OmpR family regulator
MKVLVADDSITVRKIAERQLREAGFDVALASSGEEAVASLERDRPDLVISDVIMPGKSGYDVCVFIRSQVTLAAIPVLLISGIVNDEVMRRAQACQADGVLKKPFQGSALNEQVIAVLSRRTQPAPPAAVPPSTSRSSSEPVAAAHPVAGTAKVYRITEEQLQNFRQTVARVRELEALLAREKGRSAQLLQRLEEIEILVGRAGSLYDELRRMLEMIRIADKSRVKE